MASPCSHLRFTKTKPFSFFDGKLDLESSFSGNLPFPLSSAFRLGPPNEINTTLGEIDDFRIYQRALTEDEVIKFMVEVMGTSVTM